jgi:hypothetical protein
MTPPIGSAEWADWVYSTAPVRDVATRTRPTHRQRPFVREMGRAVSTEGHEFHAFLALLFLMQQGLVVRLKEQPFTVVLGPARTKYTPDFLAQRGVAQYAVEARAARYLTRQAESELEEYARELAKVDITLLLWTNRHPIDNTVRANLMQLYRASREPAPPETLERLLRFTQTTPSGDVTLAKVVDAGFEIDHALDLCWQNKLHFDLRKPIALATTLTQQRATSLHETLFAARPNLTAWWGSLPDA